jgi:hypothetical protein
LRSRTLCQALVLAGAVFLAVPAAASALPSITVYPSSSLPATANVTVSGSGFAPGASVQIDQCTTDLSKCKFVSIQVPTNGSGVFTSVAVTVTRIFTADDPPVAGSTDCALLSCEVYAYPVSGIGTTAAAASIAFAGDPPPRPGTGGAANPPSSGTAGKKKCKKHRARRHGKCVKKKKRR